MWEVSLTDLPEWEALRAATVALYEAFAPYQLRARSSIPRCTHCVSDADDARLRATPLRELTDEELSLVLHNPGTWGEEVDVKHFLPRLFELVSLELAGHPSGLDSESLGWRIQTEGHGFTAWPASERAALTAFCLAWWEATLATWPRSTVILEERPQEVLCAIAQFSDDLGHYLAAWRQAMRRSGALAPLAHLLILISQQMTPPSWLAQHEPNAWWEQRSQQWQQVREWIEEPATASTAQRTLQHARAQDMRIPEQWFVLRIGTLWPWRSRGLRVGLRRPSGGASGVVRTSRVQRLTRT